MSWWMGAGLGFLRGGPFGAVVGGTIQYFLRKKFQKEPRGNLPGIKHQGQFITSLVVVLTRVGMESGEFSPKKEGVIQNFIIKNLGFNSSDLKPLHRLMAETQSKKPDPDRFVEEYKKSCRNNYNLLLLALCYQIVLVEDSLNEESQALIKIISLALGVAYEKHNEIRQKYALPFLKTPYNVLGLSSGASSDEIKKAYRKMVSRYHPDRVAREDEKIVREAHLKFFEIQSAYQELEEIRKL